MDKNSEAWLSFMMMFVGLGFFLFVIGGIAIWSMRDDKREDRLERERYERRLSEAREFGFGGVNQHTAESLRAETETAQKKK